MKRLLTLLLLCASTALAEQATLSVNTVLRTADSLVILKAGTVVEVLKHNDKTVSVKAGDKTGSIPWSALASAYKDEDMVSVPNKPVAKPAPASTGPIVTPAVAGKPPVPAAPSSSAPPQPPRKAQTTYGKAVEKAAEAAADHDKTMVSPTDEILGGK